MAIKIGTDSDGYTTYTNDPEELKTLSKNEKPLTVDQVANIVLSVLEDIGIVVGEDSVTINKKLYAFNEVDDETTPRPVMLTTRGNFGAGIIATFPAAQSTDNKPIIMVSGLYGGTTVVGHSTKADYN